VQLPRFGQGAGLSGQRAALFRELQCSFDDGFCALAFPARDVDTGEVKQRVAFEIPTLESTGDLELLLRVCLRLSQPPAPPGGSLENRDRIDTALIILGDVEPFRPSCSARPTSPFRLAARRPAAEILQAELA
jgi:hypothetical protein